MTLKQKYKSEYVVYYNMVYRCTNPERKDYHSYGGRGIKVCKRWLDSFENFINDMGPKPTALHQIDRLDNDKGYNPENCRWVTKRQNCLNRRFEAGELGHKNINWDKARQSFRVRFKIRGKEKHIGRYPTLDEAIKQRDKYIEENKADFIGYLP